MSYSQNRDDYKQTVREFLQEAAPDAYKKGELG